MSALDTPSQPSSADSSPTQFQSVVGRLPRVLFRPLSDLKYTLRVALALGVLFGWTLQAQPYDWQYWNASVHTPQAPGGSDAERRMFLEGEGAVRARLEGMGGTPQQGANLYKLLDKAQTSCPADRPVLVIGDYLLVGQSAYVLYPRRVDVRATGEPIERLDMANWAGGCLLYFGDQADGEQIGSLLPGLTAINCNSDGCLYGISSQIVLDTE